MPHPARPSKRAVLLYAAVATLPAFLPIPVPAATFRTWTGGATGFNSSWNDPNSWNPYGVPADGDTVVIPGVNSSDTLVTYNYPGPYINLNVLRLDRSNPTVFLYESSLSITDPYALSSTYEYLGDSSFGGTRSRGHILQSGGTNSTSSLFLGNMTGDTGLYSLSGSAVLFATSAYLGVNGNAFFTQSGGSHYTALLDLGANTGGVGTYTLSAGTLTDHNQINVGENGRGTFLHTGGTVTLSPGTGTTPRLTLGHLLGSSGTYSLSGSGVLSITDGSEVVGDNGTGSFVQSGGLHSLSYTGTLVQDSLILGNVAGFSGSYSLSAGTLSTTYGSEYVGYYGKGTFLQTGGTHAVSRRGGLYVGFQNGSSGTYSLSGSASLNLSGTALSIGGANGTFNQSGGAVSVANDPGGSIGAINLGNGSFSTATYNLSAGSISATAGYEYVGASGYATFNQTGGLNSVGSLIVGNYSVGSSIPAHGTYNLSGGSLAPTYLTVGGFGTNVSSTFNQTGGAVSLAGGTYMSVYAYGTYNLSSPDASLSAIDPSEYIYGTFNQTAGSNVLSGGGAQFLTLFNTADPANPPRYNLTGGSLSTPNLYIGRYDETHTDGYGILTFDAPATLTVSNQLQIYPHGTFAGTGSTSAAISNQGGTISPGDNGPGTLTVGALTLLANSRLLIEAGDLLATTSTTASAPSTVLLAGPFTSATPVLSYSSTFSNPQNLLFAGGSVGLTYSARADAASHTVLAVPRRIAAHAQISVTGEPGPGGATFSPGVSAGALNPAGQISLYADFPTTSGPIRLDPNGSFTTIALNGQPAPGVGGGILDGFLNYADNLNSLGQVAFQAFLSNTINASKLGIFRGDGGPLAVIARDQQPINGGPETITALPFGSSSIFYLSNLNDAGQLAFVSGIGNSSATAGVFRGDGSSLTTIAKQGQPAPGPGAGSFGATFGPGINANPSLNNAGQVAFAASVTGSTSTSGVFRSDGTTTIAIQRYGQSPPGGGGGTFANPYGAPLINDAGQVAFSSFLAGTSDGATGGLYLGNGSSTLVLARDKGAAPGGGTFSGIPYYFALNNAGQVSFFSNTSTTSGIFRSDGTSLVAIARDGQPAPGAGAGATLVVDANHPTSSIAPGGQVVIRTALANTSDGAPNNTALYIGDGTDLVPIALPGQTIPTSQGPRTLGPSLYVGSPNAYGQVPWAAFFTSGDSGNFLFTPTLHWRSTASGSWDTPTNWTLGLRPAPVHDVVLDPASAPLTVTGPAAPTTLRSLTLGGQLQPATLQLTTGPLTITGPLTLTDSSKLDLTNSTLTLTSGVLASTNTRQYLFSHQLFSSLSDPTHAPGYVPTPSGLLIKLTLTGDANLDGTLNADDYALLDSGYATGASTWWKGDFNYDGMVNNQDYLLIDTTLAQQQGGHLSPAFLSARESQFGPDYVSALLASVPEPSLLSSILYPLSSLLLTRRRVTHLTPPIS